MKKKSASKRLSVLNRVVRKPSSTKYQVVKVRVAVPAHLKSKLARRVLVAPPVRQRKKSTRHIRVALAPRARSTVMTVRVAVPRRNRPRPAAMMVNPNGWLSIFSRRKTNALLTTEFNRRRRDESKRHRMRKSTGYLDSTRRDTGMLAANSRMSAERLADAALVNSALGG